MKNGIPASQISDVSLVPNKLSTPPPTQLPANEVQPLPPSQSQPQPQPQPLVQPSQQTKLQTQQTKMEKTTHSTGGPPIMPTLGSLPAEQQAVVIQLLHERSSLLQTGLYTEKSPLIEQIDATLAQIAKPDSLGQ